MPTLELDDQTDRAITFAARLAGVTKPEIIRRLVRLYSESETAADPDQPGVDAADGRVPVHMDYQRVRTDGLFDPVTEAVEVTSGPLQGQTWKSPSGAAMAVVGDLNPGVTSNRNGWDTWVVKATGEKLRSTRRRR